MTLLDRSNTIGAGQPESHYLICGVPRSGSNLLAEALGLTGIAGYPIEYFNKRYETYFLKSWGVAYYRTYDEFVSLAKTHGSTRNKVFGAKFHWYQTRDFVKSICEVPAYRDLTLTQIINLFFPDVKYIWIKRKDKLRQAISYARAIQTNMWCEIDGFNNNADRGHVDFDFAKIDGLYGTLISHEAEWHQYFDRIGVMPLVVTYEDFCHAYERTVMDVLQYLSLEVPDSLSIRPPRLKRQSDSMTEDWLQLYRTMKALAPTR
jgi:LPS sulfotransferase NodH